MTDHRDGRAHGPSDHAHGHGHDDHDHDHGDLDHDHDHHDHDHGPAENYDHVQGGMPVLDIGGDIGAMVVLVPAETVGTELFVRSETDPALSTHTGVWHRNLGEGVVTAAVFLELVEGWYWILDPSGADVMRVEIGGGRLTEIDLTHQDPTSRGL